MLRRRWARQVTLVAYAACLVDGSQYGLQGPGKSAFHESDWEAVREDMYAFHGIGPDADELVEIPSDAAGDEENALAYSWTQAIRSDRTAMQTHRLRGMDDRRILSTTGCTGIYCFSASFRGRFGDAAFDSDQLKLPGKKGACFTLDKNVEGAMERIKYLDPSWNYSWSCKVVQQQPSDIEFVPMIWTGWDPERVQYLIETYVVPAYEAGHVKRLLGYNEPDKKNQANLGVSAAVASWPTLESTGLPLAGPSVTTSGVGTWMKDWNDHAFKYGLRVDYVAVHWYGEPSVLAFKKYMTQMYNLNGGQTPLLITEMAPADWTATSPGENRFSRATVLAFMKQILPWLEHPDQAHWIYGYAWFPFSEAYGPGTCSSLFEDDGTPTPLGAYYRSVTPDNPYGDQTMSY